MCRVVDRNSIKRCRPHRIRRHSEFCRIGHLNRVMQEEVQEPSPEGTLPGLFEVGKCWYQHVLLEYGHLNKSAAMLGESQKCYSKVFIWQEVSDAKFYQNIWKCLRK